MTDLAKENDQLRGENESLQKLLEDSMDQMQRSVDYWRNKYLAIAKAPMLSWPGWDL